MEPKEQYRVGASFRCLNSAIKTSNELFLTVCGIERCAPNHYYGPIIRDDYHLHFILSGKGTFEINGKTYHLGRGQIFVTPADVEVYYYADRIDPWHYTWVSFGGSNALYYLEKAGLAVASPIRDSYIKPEEFLSLIEKILDHHELTIANELMRYALLFEVIALLINSQNQNLPHSKIRHYDYSPDIYVENAVEYIHFNYAKLTVSDIASHIGINRSYLTRIFKQKMKVSPQEYLVSYRLDQGCRLLRTTTLAIKEIAEKLGYSNPLTFSKVFKNAYGISPRNYRRQFTNSDET